MQTVHLLLVECRKLIGFVSSLDLDFEFIFDSIIIVNLGGLPKCFRQVQPCDLFSNKECTFHFSFNYFLAAIERCPPNKRKTFAIEDELPVASFSALEAARCECTAEMYRCTRDMDAMAWRRHTNSYILECGFRPQTIFCLARNYTVQVSAIRWSSCGLIFI